MLAFFRFCAFLLEKVENYINISYLG